MTPEDWQRLQRHFEHAETLDSARQARYIEDVAVTDAALADELRGMLAHRDGDSLFLRDAVEAVASELPLSASEDRVGQRFGPYRVVAGAGRGGMGEVYVAERDDGEFEQRVAIKLIGASFFAPELVERFRVERQILARLRHPNIAQILDGGTTDNNEAYFVLEYVEGLPVDQYCRDNKLSVPARLRLFSKVCAAISYAHRNLIVHRDIKPSNILVTRDGTPKLLDFGIAKLLETDKSDPQAATAPATLLAMTPDYASPEQILGEPVTTVCDVYSLGVLLYELLTGHLPHDLSGKRPSEVERLVCDTRPEKPSTAARRTSQDGERSPLAPGRNLSSELDNIVLMALSVSPEDRYQTVRDFAADVQRFLDGQPVVAKGLSWWYVAKKFVLRNRLAVGATVLAVAGALGAVNYHIRQISTERDRVALEADKAVAVSEFLQNIFRVADPDQSKGATLTAKDALDRGARRLDNELLDQPAIRAALLTTVGSVYSYLGLYSDAISNFDKSISLRRELNDSDGLVETLVLLGDSLRGTDELERARAVFSEALEIKSAGGEDGDIAVAHILTGLGQVHLYQAEYDQALDVSRRSLAIQERLGSEDVMLRAQTLHGMGQVLQFMNDPAGAEDYLRRSLAMLRTIADENPTDLIEYMHNLATVLHDRGSFDEAEKLYLEVYDLELRVAGEDSPDRDAVMTNLGRLYQDTGRLDEAEIYLREAVAHARRLHGDQHRYTAYNQNNLAALLHARGEHDAALAMFDTVQSVYEQSLPADHPYFASTGVARAALLSDMGRYEEAGVVARRALEICKAALTEGHWLTARSQAVLGAALLAQNDVAAARPLLNSAWEVLRTTTRSRMTRHVLEQLVTLHGVSGNVDEADRYQALLSALPAS